MNTKLITNGIPVADATGHVTTTSFSELAKQVCELMGMQIVDKAGELTFVAGGRNLLPDSEKEIGHEISGLQDEYISYGSEWTNMRIFDEHGIGRFTLSFEARSIGKAGRLNVYSTPGEPEAFKYTFQQCAIDLTNEWKRYAVPINVILRNPDSNRTALSFFGAPYGSGIVPHIRKIKLERGNVATDWTPAPEDLEKRLDILENRGGVNFTLSTSYEETQKLLTARSEKGGLRDGEDERSIFGAIDCFAGGHTGAERIKRDNPVNFDNFSASYTKCNIFMSQECSDFKRNQNARTLSNSWRRAGSSRWFQNSTVWINSSYQKQLLRLLGDRISCFWPRSYSFRKQWVSAFCLEHDYKIIAERKEVAA